MHYAKIEKSDRLKRLLSALGDGAWHSTMDLISRANICAVNSAVSELRGNGYPVECRKMEGRFEYMLKSVGGP
jgi:biotin operon repressor